MFVIRCLWFDVVAAFWVWVASFLGFGGWVLLLMWVCGLVGSGV